MQVTINISSEQEKAILTQFISIKAYLQQMTDARAYRIMNNIVKEYAKGNCKVIGVTTEEQATINERLKDKIIVNVDDIPNEVRKIIVRRADVKSAVEKITEQEAEFKETNK